ncbi:MAG: bifunctional demethylmenaquinone methyltransferase/2-methoxy-6-polyprenyl-1,4-benzoquinol methylase UbiE [Smithellaceae bacterium]|nr:bifunctional demethylmenaquinone methyltransferase/2-methoxy-6-polyprenyl-1,4-benzoquinol methylase UbiE [Syntrophaceae bacterium]MDD4239831.1 bifunctional demethylmenaquinone methyltransferase/2-methoxy-6-polyprenyl-1,4-benzoquinol methylase UbiE [Smithellaceae bacterium]NLX52592.1 bifunctional demethylmenaquinone methyltransferase/2-methoxy-6-polyprenyl-1,4-benzoquinol methylase UbiE [Deltaproteobacteria bacterium]
MGKASPEKYPQVRTITDSERIRVVQEIFSTITGKYDFLNRFLSLRRDVYWRKFAAAKMIFFRTHRYLDVACGTGDLSIAAARRHPHITVTGVDFVEAMVAAAKRKVLKEKLADRISLAQADALCLPFSDASFDVTGIAFGIRNIPDRSRALSEMLRVTVPGGQVMVLEMTFVRNRLFKGLYYLYLNHLLPVFAKAFSKNPAAYYYLADSIMNFPDPDEFSKILAGEGMVDVEKYPLTFGIAWLHIGKKAT